MEQFYFLSIILNLVAGIVVAWELLEEKTGLSRVINPDIMRSQPLRLGLGIATFVVGFLKLLSPLAGASGSQPWVVGDLLPALIGMVMGMILVLQYYRERSEISSDFLKTLESIFVEHASIFGIAGIVIAVVHIVLPGVLFL